MWAVLSETGTEIETDVKIQDQCFRSRHSSLAFRSAGAGRRPKRAAQISVAVPFPGSIEAFSVDWACGNRLINAAAADRPSRVWAIGIAGAAAPGSRDTLEKPVGAQGQSACRVPLTPETWAASSFGRVEYNNLVSAILSDRTASLLYFGLSALDDETLLWLTDKPKSLLRSQAPGGVCRVRTEYSYSRAGLRTRRRGRGRPGSPLSMPIPHPDAFIERLIAGNGRLALLYDTIEHLDGAHQRFALGLRRLRNSRDSAASAPDAFTLSAPDWRTAERPFAKPPIDGAVLLSTIQVLPDGDMPAATKRVLGSHLSRRHLERPAIRTGVGG